MATRRKAAVGVSLFAFQDIITSVTGIMILITLLFSLELTRARQQQDQQQPPDVSKPEELAQLEQEVAALEQRLRLRTESFEANQTLLNQAAVSSPRELAKLRGDLTARLADAEAAIAELDGQSTQLQETLRQLEVGELAAIQQQLQTLERQRDRLREEIASTLKTPKVVYNRNPAAAKVAWILDLSGTRVAAVALSGTGRQQFPVRSAESVPRQLLQWIKQRDKRKEYFVLVVRPSALEWFYELKHELEQLGFDQGIDLVAEEAAVEFGPPNSGKPR